MANRQLQIDSIGSLKDSNNRTIILRGINVDPASKLPIQIKSTYEAPGESFWDGDNVSYVNRPFPLDEAPAHFERIRSWGFNTIRYIYTWEALEHKGPGIYDDEFISYTIEVLKLLDSYGFYVFLDPHQDTWSRFSGGSGAPLWTLYALGLEPKNFKATNAAIVQNLSEDPENYPKMIWPTNYYKLANQVAFTLFFAGSDFAPNAIINGKSIEDYLQCHLLGAMLYFYRRIKEETNLFNSSVFAVETLNEPNPGLIGIPDITVLPEAQHLKKGATPTALQAMILGSGKPCTVDVYKFQSLGSKKIGTELIDPKNTKAWVEDDRYDKKYGFKRDPGWKLGRCIWAQNGVWDDETNEVLHSTYFAFAPDDGQPLDETVFLDKYWSRYWNKFYFAMREFDKDIFLLCQPPTMAIPPNIKDSAFIDSKVIYSPHFYDGLTLVQKHWSNLWNVDVLGVLRGRYSSPAFAIRIGRTAIRNCLRDQLKAIKQEGLDNMGQRPCLMSETGMPFDLDDKQAYKSGDYTSQEEALDALGYALEGSQIHHTLWTYCSLNRHAHGDNWNGEDFSFYCKGDQEDSSATDSSSISTSDGSEFTLMFKSRELKNWSTIHGSRAEAAIARPFPVAVVGTFLDYGFDMRKFTFTMNIDGDYCIDNEIGTEIVLPEYNYPGHDFTVSISSGKWKFDSKTRILTWWHDKHKQSIEIISTSPPSLGKDKLKIFNLAEEEATITSSIRSCFSTLAWIIWGDGR